MINAKFIKSITDSNNALKLASFVVFITVVSVSIWQGSYNYDPHHWGLMFSNAKDLYDGKIPYKEIFIQYGFFTTLVHTLAFLVFHNFFGMILITSVFYAAGLIVLSQTAKIVLSHSSLALIVLITIFSFHSIAIYPWSNYIAFPLIMLFIYIIIRYKNNNTFLNIVSGLLAGVAILSREGLFPAVLLILIFSFYIYKDENLVKKICFLLAGLLLPLLSFFFYLATGDLIGYWKLLSWDLPRIYATSFFPEANPLSALNGLFITTFKNTISGDVRWILVFFIIITNISILIIGIFQGFKDEKRDIYFLSFSSLVLLSSSLHIPEVFRIATGSILGFIPLLYYFSRYKVGKIFIVLIILFQFFTLYKYNSGNYFYPNIELRKNSVLDSRILFFSGQKWSREVFDYYNDYKNKIDLLKRSNCNLSVQYNGTNDPLYTVLSDLSPYQPGPFVTISALNKYRPDLNIDKKIESNASIVLLYRIKKSQLIDYSPPIGFKNFAVLNVPGTYFMPFDEVLVILIPKSC
jgi:hypothetical protein